MRKRSIKQGYLKKVRKMRNKKWTDEQKLKIFTLRRRGMSAQEVAKKFKTTVQHIYNITRLTKKALKDECYICGHKLNNDEKKQKSLVKACDTCKESSLKYKSKRRNKALKKGLCGVCGKNPIIPGKKSCEKCISMTYRRRVSQGLCGHCGKHKISKYSECLCRSCLNTNNIRIREKREKNYV